MPPAPADDALDALEDALRLAHARLQRGRPLDDALKARLRALAPAHPALPLAQLADGPDRAEAYALVARALHGSCALPRLRPPHARRALLHALVGAAALAFLRFTPERVLLWTASSAAALVWSLEALRLRSPAWNARVAGLFAATAHPDERHRVNSGTWYVSGLALLAWTRRPALAAVGVAVLALADPAAGIVGRRLGRGRLPGGRSVAGSLAFVLVGFGAASGALLLFGARPLLAPALLGALAGAAAELLSGPVDDNLTIPLAAAAGAWAGLALG
ncbi:MAG TPA: hypothetical protein RMH85_30895 [Polyangiaceae bacterium LLY-WYZ-15_(1-7)]|nr:hypothetical protein [Myxococcales bacterium]MAT25097.1 hypothetical protein [Sandaracinus sp.]HJK89895.1 hypothetical protein [Polyangiaceae bacterium LLY-WYZ-15_(1-7)]MBJ72684.1 hypothetical protein [Sandaracinus sp.]HJL05625.1 hypothetical protein [Polyangiaceae bacterium LLY-WYZ-15_(1-7)]